MRIEKEIDHIERERLFVGPVEAICDPKMIAHCRDKYPNHSKGCPKWGCTEDGCPPNVRFFPNVYSKEVYIAAVKFNFADYLALYRRKHSNWTDRALRNPLYWQSHVRSDLRQFLFEYLNTHPEIDGEIVFNPEAMGVNVFETCAQADIILEKTPTFFVHKVVLIAKKLGEDHS